MRRKDVGAAGRQRFDLASTKQQSFYAGRCERHRLKRRTRQECAFLYQWARASGDIMFKTQDLRPFGIKNN
jgi:hypothetical protein